MIANSIRRASLVLLVSLSTVALAEEPAAMSAEKIRSMLVQHPSWTAHWSHGSDSGATDMVIETRERRVVAKFHNVTLGGSCEREITISPDTLKFDMCYDSLITLHFDPHDPLYPFKGKSGGRGYDYKLQQK